MAGMCPAAKRSATTAVAQRLPMAPARRTNRMAIVTSSRRRSPVFV
jgi:hypothetical protein